MSDPSVAFVAVAAAAMARGLTRDQAQGAWMLLADGSGRIAPTSVTEAYDDLDWAFQRVETL